MGFPQHSNEVMDVGMDVAVGQQTQEMQRLAGNGVGDQVFQVSEHTACRFDGLTDQLRALRVDLAAAQRVVADLGVAHIIIGGQTDGGAVASGKYGAGGKQMIQRGVLATATASPLPPSPLPTPSMITRTMGFSIINPSRKELFSTSLHY